jgi:hypothetical protein
MLGRTALLFDVELRNQAIEGRYPITDGVKRTLHSCTVNSALPVCSLRLPNDDLDRKSASFAMLCVDNSAAHRILIGIYTCMSIG